MDVFSRALVLLLAAGAGIAQTPDPRPAYEAASVKLDTSGSTSSRSTGSPGQIVITNQSLKRLIERAYDAKPFQVTGPDWLENVRLDITAKYPPDTKGTDRMLMLRTLLEERFKLTVHHESKEMPGYTMVVAKGGFKLKPVEPGGSSTNSRGGRVQDLRAAKTSMASLADLVARYLDEMVIDKTGIDGVYNFELHFTTNDQVAVGSDADAVPSLFVALQETLGLRLQPQKVPVDVIVVDSAERAPIEN